MHLSISNLYFQNSLPFQVVYDEVTELQGHVLMLIVKSKTTFVGAINIQLCSVTLNEEKWYPLGNSIIWALLWTYRFINYSYFFSLLGLSITRSGLFLIKGSVVN